MFIVKKSPNAGATCALRDAGDGVMKQITSEGVVFIKAPHDPAVEVTEVTAAEAAKHLERLEKVVATQAREKSVAGLQAKHAELLRNAEASEAALVAEKKNLNAIEAELDDVEKSLDDLGAAPAEDEEEEDEEEEEEETPEKPKASTKAPPKGKGKGKGASKA